MASSRSGRAAAYAVGLVGCGVAGDAAWRGGSWGSLTGTILLAVWLAALVWWSVARQARAHTGIAETPTPPVSGRLLLDAVPTPILMIEGANVRVLNRAARRLFGADDRVVPGPPALLRSEESYLRHEGKQYRIDRVTLGGAAVENCVVALIDFEHEERVAEARATAGMIHVIGHELLNGLAPIVSLAESGEAALDLPNPDPELLREILATLARRAESLQRFTRGYRDLARLPPPQLAPVRLSGIADDLARLFAGRWPQVLLTVRVADDREWPLDRDQLHQALWAILQNAAEAALAVEDPDARVMLSVRFGEDLIVEVQDSGAGIDVEQVSRIFRPFHTTKVDGTGIGLSLARQIALSHGGSLSLLPRTPTTFRLSVPLPDV